MTTVTRKSEVLENLTKSIEATILDSLFKKLKLEPEQRKAVEEEISYLIKRMIEDPTNFLDASNSKKEVMFMERLFNSSAMR